MYPNLATKGIAKLDSVVTVVDALRLCHIFSGSKGWYADLGGNGLIVVASAF